jgi:alanine racemase
MSAGLEPVMRLRARVVRVQDLAAGANVGYGATYRVPGRGSPVAPGAGTRIVTLPVGYEDGVPRSAGNRGWVWIAGKRHPIAGRVSMDSISVDVGDSPVAVGDEAVLFGNGLNESEGIRVEEAADWADTIGYELLVRVGQRVPRRYTE